MLTSRTDLDLELARLASGQHGVVRMDQLAAIGFRRDVVSRWARRGRLHRMHRGVYLVGHAAPSEKAVWIAAALAGGEGAVISHGTAAQLWGISTRFAQGTIDVSLSGASAGRPGVLFHNQAQLEPEDVTERDAIPVTSVSRTLVDLSRCLTAPQLAHVFHEAAYRELLDIQAVRACMSRRGRRWRMGVVRAAITMHLGGSAGTRSYLEDRLLELVELWGLPTPRVNVRVDLGGEVYEVDVWWPEARVCIEVDGVGHARPRAKSRDEGLDRACQAHGVTLMRVTSADLYGDVRALRAAITEALGVNSGAPPSIPSILYVPPPTNSS